VKGKKSRKRHNRGSFTSQLPRRRTGRGRLRKEEQTRKLATVMAGPPNATAMKQRIISYMNADHPNSLEHYLKFYSKITPASKSAKMVDVDLDSICIEYLDASGTTHTSVIKLDPPMASLSDARARLVAMAEEASGKSFHQPPDLPSPAPVHPVPDIPIKPLVWTPPEWPGLVSLAAICFGFWALHHPYPLSPEGPLQAYLPAFLVEFGRKFREQLFAMMIGIHVIEALSNAKTCFEQGSSVTVLIIWTINGFFEGGPSMLRLSRLVENRTKFDVSRGNLN